jgi:hypothetical protein
MSSRTLIEQLVAMGFDESPAAYAIGEAKGDLNVCSCLFSSLIFFFFIPQLLKYLARD